MADWSEFRSEGKAYNYVRVGFNANALKSAISKKIKQPCIALTKDKVLANQLARVYGALSTPYVPRSNLKAKHHHLQAFRVSDGRVTWYRKDSDGDEIADILNEGPIRGKFRQRRPAGNDNNGLHSHYLQIYSPISHAPRAHWSTAVVDIKSTWKKFVDEATLLVKERMEKTK